MRLAALALAAFLALAGTAMAITPTQIQTRVDGIYAEQRATLAQVDFLRLRQTGVVNGFRAAVNAQFDYLIGAAGSDAERNRLAVARDVILFRLDAVAAEIADNALWAHEGWEDEVARTQAFRGQLPVSNAESWVAETLALQTGYRDAWDIRRDIQHENVSLLRDLINAQFAILRPYAPPRSAEKARLAAAREVLNVGQKALHVEAEQDAGWIWREWRDEVVHSTSFLEKF